MPTPMSGSEIPRGSGWFASRPGRKVPQEAPGHLESALAVARAAIDATEYARAREALAPFIAAPTQRVALLMAEIERTEHGDTGGKARAWTLRAVRALHDPVWTADGYVSEKWRPVSPVHGRLDAFQWQMPLSALPSDKNAAVEASPFNEVCHRQQRLFAAADSSAGTTTSTASPGRSAPGSRCISRAASRRTS